MARPRRLGRLHCLLSVPSTSKKIGRMLEAIRTLADHFTIVSQGLDDVTLRLVPELQRRGIFRRDYQGTTLREHLGLRRPANRFFA